MSEENPEKTKEEIEKARKEFAQKYGDTHIGGKGTQRRKKPAKHRGGKVEVDKKIEAVAKKAQSRKLNEIVEINIFKDDNSVIQFKKPTLEYSFKEKVSFVSGVHETKQLKDVFTTLVKQLGPKQFSFMKDFSETIKTKDKKAEKIDEAPELVADFDEVAKDDAKDNKEDNEGKDKKKKKKAKKDKEAEKKETEAEEKPKEATKEEGEKKEEKAETK